MAAPVVSYVFPSDEAESIVVGVAPYVVFETEVDPTSFSRAFFIEGPDTDRWTGAGLQVFDLPATPEPELFLDSPDYQGIVQGEFSFVKLQSTGSSSASDPTYSPGAGSYRTKVIFTPSIHLSPTTEYTVYLAGDEESTDDVKVGVASRTVFDVSLGSNLGDGEVSVSGGYTGTIDDTYVISITLDGDMGTATFEWYRMSDPLTVKTGVTSNNEALLNEGVYLSFSGDNFLSGDSYSFNVAVPEYMEETYKWTFTTGSGSITSLPSTTSTSVLGDPNGSSTSSSVTSLGVESTNPASNETFVPIYKKTIVILFSADLDEATITQDSVTVNVGPTRGVFTGQGVSEFGSIPKVLEVDGNKLTITI